MLDEMLDAFAPVFNFLNDIRIRARNKWVTNYSHEVENVIRGRTGSEGVLIRVGVGGGGDAQAY